MKSSLNSTMNTTHDIMVTTAHTTDSMHYMAHFHVSRAFIQMNEMRAIKLFLPWDYLLVASSSANGAEISNTTYKNPAVMQVLNEQLGILLRKYRTHTVTVFASHRGCAISFMIELKNVRIADNMLTLSGTCLSTMSKLSVFAHRDITRTDACHVTISTLGVDPEDIV